MGGGYAKAIGVVRYEMPGIGTDLVELSERYGYRLVFTVVLDLGPFLTALVIAQHVAEHDAVAVAVAVADVAHVSAVRQLVTELAALVTPLRGLSARASLVGGGTAGERSC